MKKKILVSGPILTASGYGEMARFALRALTSHADKFDIYINPTTWGQTGWLFEENEEFNYIKDLRAKTEQHAAANGKYNIALQITIPNEWKQLAPVNIGYTAGIETHVISPAWLGPSNMMDKIITISEFAKQGFVNTIFTDQDKNQLKVNTEVAVVHFPQSEIVAKQLDLDLPCEFNFLTVNQWGPRKNMEFLIQAFVEEFREEEVGLVIKTNQSTDSIGDRLTVEDRLKRITATLGDRKCKIHLVHGRLDEASMAGLYRHEKIKVFATATHGEGFGFPIYEATQAGLPVIATDWSGHLDFLTMPNEQGKEKKMFGRVDADLKLIDQTHVWPGVMEAQAGWAYPHMSSLRARLREAQKDYPRFKSWAKKLAEHNKQKFDKQKLYDKFVFSLI
jgi:glycosyltransferase involved in cell wall biosynthesis